MISLTLGVSGAILFGAATLATFRVVDTKDKGEALGMSGLALLCVFCVLNLVRTLHWINNPEAPW